MIRCSRRAKVPDAWGQAMRARRAGAFCLAAILVAGLAAPASAIDRRVRVVNDSSHDIVRFFAVSVGAPDPTESMLGDDILAAGSFVVLNFEDGSGYCRYRFRAIFDDGLDLLRESVNVCEVGSYRYTD